LVPLGAASVLGAGLIGARLAQQRRRWRRAHGDIDVRVQDDDQPYVDYGHDPGDTPAMRVHVDPGRAADHTQADPPEVPHDD